MEPPHHITIFWEENSKLGFAMIWDGKITDHLCWDEMLGSVASITLTGKPLYRSRVIGDDEWLEASPKQIKEGN